MKTEFRCPRCGQAFATNRRSFRSSRALSSACGLRAARFPRVAIRLAPEPSTYQLSPVALVPSVGRSRRQRPRHDAIAANHHSSRFAWLEHVRPWVFESSHVQGIGTWLVILSAADLLMTFTLLRRSAAFFESNPIAQWFFVAMEHGRDGLLQVFAYRRCHSSERDHRAEASRAGGASSFWLVVSVRRTRFSRAAGFTTWRRQLRWRFELD